MSDISQHEANLLFLRRAGAAAVLRHKNGGPCSPHMHGKLAGLDRVYAMVARLSTPVDYKAIDGGKVDLVFLLLSPPDAGAEHLKALAAVSRLVRNAGIVEKLRGARSRDALAAVLLGAEERDAA